MSTPADPTPGSGASTDSRRVLTYLTAPESDDYIAIMEVLESSVTDLTPIEVESELRRRDHPLERSLLETRLDALRGWGAVSSRTDSARILRYADLLSRNWRYTASPIGRQVQRFYRTMLAGRPVLREIPLTSLNRVVTAAEALAGALADHRIPPGTEEELVERIGSLFTSHDDLDQSLVGAEDALAGLADRFDLDDEHTAELKGLLVDYATRVAAELDSGSARAYRALEQLSPHFVALAALSVNASQARVLIERGALTASRGGRVEDWTGLTTWCHPDAGRANRFSLRLVRTLPGMHANLRRLHSSAGTASSRARALAFARASLHPELGTQIWQAVLGDHSWRKFSGEADEHDSGRNPSWRGGPQVPVPELLRQIGRAGPRGRGGRARDDSEARRELDRIRSVRAAAHDAAVAEVLTSPLGAQLSESAARVALAALMMAARATPRGPVRTGSRDGLACTLVRTADGPGISVGILRAPAWRVLLPGRTPIFHRPGERPARTLLEALPAVAVSDEAVRVAVDVERIERVA